MPLIQAVEAVFAADGALSSAQSQFQPRAAQTEMAVAVAQTIVTGGALVVEAGTGVGKTFAYLVPALLSGERVLVSTATKALQDQLFSRDLPRLVQALNTPVRTALLKGRSSYLCLHRMEQARHDLGAHERHLAHVLARIELWSQATRTGDLAELPGLDERSPALPFITSTRENCLGSSCPRFAQCHVQLARREALAADVVVINHHLFFADLAVRESGMAELLPSVRVVIFDEAHQLNATGVQFLGVQLGTGQLLDYARDLQAAGVGLARGLQDWAALAFGIEEAARDLRMAAGPAGTGGRRAWVDRAPDAVDPLEWDRAMGALISAFQATLAALDQVSGTAPDFVRLHERAVQIQERLAGFSHDCGPEAVRWLDVGVQLRLMESPLDIAPKLQSLWLGPAAGPSAWEDDEPAPAEAQPGGRAWVFTSATLGDDPALSWFTEPCGLQSARTLRVHSPFDYARQAALYVPADLPRPSDPSHALQLARWAGDAVARLGGRTLLLTTTLRSLKAIGGALQDRFPPGSPIDVLVQGQGGKRQIVERFRNASGELDDDGPARPGCVLVASASFWEGLDVPGEALQLVIIDKLPFPPPGDPVIDARTHRLELQGRSAFKDFALPEAAVALKQGAGRLIRSESDAGVLVIADTRLTTMGYGKRLLRALPPMRRLQTQAELDELLDALRRGEG
ncbi:MAG: ATP-dependent DNA helicase [Comamonadaceae bacterium]|nr:MAG: ATP-dependent DNA helicase [Comamonadaceae bacterium]